MKYRTPLFLLLSAMLMSLSGCEVFGDIFRAGMGVGIFLVLVVLAVIIYILVKIRRKS